MSLSVTICHKDWRDVFMAEEKRRIKRAAVSEETRRGRHRAAVNPNAKPPEERRGEERSERRRGLERL